MTDSSQRYAALVNGGLIKVTEAVMKGTGPEGPRGPEGPVGKATTIKNRLADAASIQALGKRSGEAYIAEDTGRLWVYDDTTVRWIDVGRIVGPPGYLQSVSAGMTTNVSTQVPGTGAWTTVTWNEMGWNDTEIVDDGNTGVSTPIVTHTPGSMWSAFTVGAINPVAHIITATISLQYEQSARGWVKAGLYNHGVLVKTVRTYVDTATSAERDVSFTWIGSSSNADSWTVQISANVDSTVITGDIYVGRLGGGTGPRGYTGIKGDKGDRGDIGPAGPVGGPLPVGAVLPFAGNIGISALSDWLPCAGQAVSRTVYALLFDSIGTTYGNGDGSTTFNVPDLRGRVIAAIDNQGGTSANTVPTGNSVGTKMGTEKHTLQLAEMPIHKHGVNSGTGASDNSGTTSNGSANHSHTGTTDPAGSHGHREQLIGETSRTLPPAGSTEMLIKNAAMAGGYYTALDGVHQHNFTTSPAGSAHTHSIGESGGGGPHNNMQPTLFMNYIIKAR